MVNFIRNIFSFIWNLLLNIRDVIATLISTNGLYNTRIMASVEAFNSFLDKNIVNGDFININLTYREAFLYLIPIIFIFLFIILMIKLILKLLSFFRI